MEQYKGRANALVVRGKRVLMVKHRVDGEEYWILPGGGVEDGETPEQAAVRELKEECGITGRVLRSAGYFARSDGKGAYTYLIDAGEQEPALGFDPGIDEAHRKLVGVSWKSLDDLSERDRAWLFACGLLCCAEIENELESWTREVIPPKRSGIKIRTAVIADSGDICGLSARELGYSYPAEKTREKLEKLLESASDRVFVAECGGRVVGYIHACDYDVLYAPHMKNIMGIAVSSDHRRMGIGKALISAVEQWAAETGAEGIRLNSGKTREGAHAFYRSIGFKGDKEQLNFKKYF